MESLERRWLLAADLVISEFLASNDNDLRDEDHERPDWIEILNVGGAAVQLGGWSLTDNADIPMKWQFPDVELAAGKRLVVFASGNDRADAGSPLHTSFRLSRDGGYLGLVRPDGSVAFDFGPSYPPQLADVSYGMPQATETVVLHQPGDPVRAFVPSSADLDLSWTEAGFDDLAWTSGVTGVGYERGSGFEDAIGLDVGNQMQNVNAGAYVRLPFVLDDPSHVFSLTLSMQYNDGFVAYLNGVEVARRNAPANVTWNSDATARRRDDDSLTPENFDLSGFVDLLGAGNVLAIHGLNDTSRDSSFLIVPRLVAETTAEIGLDARHFFVHPSAGRPNGLGSTSEILNVVHFPNVPKAGDDLVVTSRLVFPDGSESPVMTLHYRVMYGAEETVPMLDDGAHGDGVAGDGVFGATLPTAGLRPGQMIRYRITAGQPGEEAYFQSPPFADPLNSQQYYGTVVENPAIESHLPVVHLFVEDPEASETREGTHGSLFHDGRFYDNIEIDITGREMGSAGPEKSHDIFFPRDKWFEIEVDGQRLRMDDFNLLTDYFSRDKIRIPLAYDTYQLIGTPSHLSFPVRVERNGEFHGTYSFVDGGEERFLERAGLDPRGALYKMNLGFSSSGGFKKQTRTYEDNADLESFFAGMATADLTDRIQFLMDHVNIPATVNFLVGLVVAAHADCCRTNTYFYRDTEGTGEWEPLPYDVDSSFGRGGVGPVGITEGGLWVTDAPINITGHNSLFTILFRDVPEFTEIYLRRLRTVMDQFLQPPDTPSDQLGFERRIDDLVASLALEAPLDYAKWGSWGENPTWEEQINLLRNEYFPRRRVYLYGLVGDMDLSGTIDTDDIDDFFLGLNNPDAYEATYGVSPSLYGNTDFVTHSPAAGREVSDLDLDYDDIAGFVALARGGAQPSIPVPPAQTADVEIRFGEVEVDPVSGNQDEEYIQIVNPSNRAVDISGWRLAGGVRHTFRPGTVIPAGGALYVSPNVGAFRARGGGPSGGQGLFVQGNYAGHVSGRGETIQLLAPDGTRVATIATPPAPAPPPDERLESAMRLLDTGKPDFAELIGLVFSTAGVAVDAAVGGEAALAQDVPATVSGAAGPFGLTARDGTQRDGGADSVQALRIPDALLPRKHVARQSPDHVTVSAGIIQIGAFPRVVGQMVELALADRPQREFPPVR